MGSPPLSQLKESTVSRAQYAFLIGVLLVWLAWAAGWVVLAGHRPRTHLLAGCSAPRRRS